jgi:hypothetical protein
MKAEPTALHAMSASDFRSEITGLQRELRALRLHLAQSASLDELRQRLALCESRLGAARHTAPMGRGRRSAASAKVSATFLKNRTCYSSTGRGLISVLLAPDAGLAIELEP